MRHLVPSSQASDRSDADDAQHRAAAVRSWCFDDALLAAARPPTIVPFMPVVSSGTGAAIMLLGRGTAMAGTAAR